MPFGGAFVDCTGANQRCLAQPRLPAGSSTNPFQFTGRENDGTGLYYYRARYYNPTLGRFISQDPLGFAGSGPNLYGYAAESPLNFIDPFGLDCVGLTGMAIGRGFAYVGVAIFAGVTAVYAPEVFFDSSSFLLSGVAYNDAGVIGGALGGAVDRYFTLSPTAAPEAAVLEVGGARRPMNRVDGSGWFDWHDFLHLPGIVPREFPSVRTAAIAGGLAGIVIAGYYSAGALAMLVGALAGGYAAQTAAFSLRRAFGEDFLGKALRMAIRIGFGLVGAAGIVYGIYFGLQIASNGRLGGIGGVGFFLSGGILMLTMACAPNVMLRYSRPAIGLTLGCICLLLTMTVVASMVMYPSPEWIVGLVFCALPTFVFLKRPPRFPMSPEEILWGPYGIYGMMMGSAGRQPARPKEKNREDDSTPEQ